MVTTQRIDWSTPSPWLKTVATLLPLWLVALAVMGEGFPAPPVSIEAASVFFLLAVALSILLLWQRWMTIELLLYTFLPLAFVFGFDEISTAYKSPFILLCTLVLSVGLIGYQHSTTTWWRAFAGACQSCQLSKSWQLFILVAAAVVCLALAWHAMSNYWQVVAALNYGHCFPDAADCGQLAGHAPPWWALFFGAFQPWQLG
jgi:hypothetical protein